MHLHVVLCNPAGNPATVLVVSFNTPTVYTDPAVILRPGDHPFLKRETAVSYNLTRVMGVEELELREQRGKRDEFQRRTPVTEHVFRIIVVGALTSEYIPKRMKALLMERLTFEVGL